jgi:hypothetical protein
MCCGYCGAERERGDVCCPGQAANQGRLHATCTHPPPEDLTPAWLALYEEACPGDARPATVGGTAALLGVPRGDLCVLPGVP